MGKKSGRTRLPARPPAIKATPIKSTTLARQAAEPSCAHGSEEKAEVRWDLSRSEVMMNPTVVSRSAVDILNR